MNKELKFVTIFMDDAYFTWQCHMWLESLREIGMSDKAIVLIFTPKFRQQNKTKFQQIIDLYPEVECNWYKDEEGIVSSKIGTYIPIIRPWTAMKYWQDHPEMKDKAVLYCDSDILFTKNFNIDHLLDDDIIYCSDTNSYINATYFDSKIKDVLPEKLEEYKTIDVLDTASRMAGINRQICEKNNMHSGGTQYLFKNIDVDYWRVVYETIIPTLQYLRGINRQYFASESKGYQSWTIDMWLVLWELWRRGQETKVVKELDFCWVHDQISKLDKMGIYHNAGATNEGTDDFPIFYKGKYHQGSNPMVDPHLDKILNNEKSMKHCTGYYVKKMDELRNKYKLVY
jgi:hypothetical protein